jgi:hypothetical protein
MMHDDDDIRVYRFDDEHNDEAAHISEFEKAHSLLRKMIS